MSWKNCTLRAFAFGALVASGLCMADVSDDEPRCREFLGLAVPAADIRPATPGCDAQALYYETADYVAARACAYAERKSGDADVFGGSAILMMLYANGQGVARNIPLARKFACEADGAPAEVSGRLDHLSEMAKDKNAKPLDVCDDITSGMMMGFCASRGAEDQSRARQSAVLALRKNWSAPEKAAFAALRKAADAYFEAAEENEVDMSGTARGMMVVEAREALETDFLDHLQRYEKGELPKGGAAEFKQADAELNRVYAAGLRALKPDADGNTAMGTVNAGGVRKTEIAWIAYRDAWVAFGKAKYPDVSADAWRTEFTLLRSAELRDLGGAEE